MTTDFEDYDPEIKAMDDMYQAAKAVDMDALNRIIKWLLDKRKEDSK